MRLAFRPDRILILRLSAVGDVVNALPVVAALRRAYPKACIDWVVEDRGERLVSSLAGVTRVLVLPRRRWRKMLRRPREWSALAREVTRYVRDLRSADYDLVLDLQGNFKSGVHSWAAGGRRRVGFSLAHCKEGNYFCNQVHVDPGSVRMNRLRKNLAMLERLGIADPAAAPPVRLRSEVSLRARELLVGWSLAPGRFAILHPGASDLYPYKRWPTASFASLAERLVRERGWKVVLSWGPGEDVLARQVAEAAAVPVVAPAECMDLPGLAGLLREAALFVGGDTAPLHLAGVLGVPSVGLFGPTDPELFRPPQAQVRCARAGLACSPCTREEMRRCPAPRCMTSLGLDVVWGVVEEVAPDLVQVGN